MIWRPVHAIVTVCLGGLFESPPERPFVLIDHNLSALHPRKSLNHLYLSLMASDHPGGRQYRSLRDGGYVTDMNAEISFPSEITVRTGRHGQF